MKRAVAVILLLFVTAGFSNALDPLFRGIPTGETISVGSPSAGEHVCVQAKKGSMYYVSEVCMDLTNDLSSAYLIIKKIYPLPTEYGTPDGIAYGYFFLSGSNIRDTDYSGMDITFQVPAGWISNNSIASVSLAEYENGVWGDTPTSFKSSDADYYYYTSRKEGDVFRVFGIMGSMQPALPVQPPEEETPVVIPPAGEVTCPAGMLYNETSGECYTPVLVPTTTTDMTLLIIIGALLIAMFSVLSYVKFKIFGKKKYPIRGK